MVAPGRATGWIRRRGRLPAPLHLAGSLAAYRHLPVADRLGLGRAVSAAPPRPGRSRARPITFGRWLADTASAPGHRGLWDLITVPTVNLPAAEASLAMAAKVFQTGLLTDPGAADIGWSRVPLGRLHGERAGAALRTAGVEVLTGERVVAVEEGGALHRADRARRIDADAVIVAVPHDVSPSILPAGALPARPTGELGTSAVVDVHLVFDRRSRPRHGGRRRFARAVGVRPHRQRWCRARPVRGGVGLGGRRPARTPPDELITGMTAALAALLPGARQARVVDSLVTKERAATFRAVPGPGRCGPRPATGVRGLAVAGAWTDTGWPATMEGAVRSGRSAALVALLAAGQTRNPPEEVA